MDNISTEIFDIAKFLYENEECEVIVNRYGQVEDVSFDNVDYEDFCAYAMDCSEEDFEKAEIYLKSLLMNDVKFYSEYSRYLELNDNRTLYDITIPEGVEFDMEEYSVVRDMAVNQLSQEIHTEVYMLGRSGRHICVDNTFNNLVHYKEFKQKQIEWEAWLVNVINQELADTPKDDLSESLNAGEYVARCLNCGADVAYTKKDVCNDIDGTYIECPSCGATFDVDVPDSLHNKKEEAIDWVGDTKVNDNGTVTIDGRERTADSIKAEIKSLRDELKRSKEAYSNKQIRKYQRSYDKFRYTRQIEKLKAFLDLLKNNSTDLEEDCTQAGGVDAGKVTLFGSDEKDKKEEAVSNDETQIAKWIKGTVDWLVEGETGCGTYKLDDRLAICVGWSGGYDENDIDEDYIHSKESPEYCINAAIKVWTSDSMRTDLDYINCPYDEDEVYDDSITIAKDEDYTQLAKTLLDIYATYKGCEISEDGMITSRPDEESLEEDVDDTRTPHYIAKCKLYDPFEEVEEDTDTYLLLDEKTSDGQTGLDIILAGSHFGNLMYNTEYEVRDLEIVKTVYTLQELIDYMKTKGEDLAPMVTDKGIPVGMQDMLAKDLYRYVLGEEGDPALEGNKEIKKEARLTDYLGILQIRDILQKNPDTANKEFAIKDNMIVEVGTGDDVANYKATKNDDGEWELLEENLTTTSGEYNTDEYNKICDKLKQAYKDAWDNKISYNELENIKKQSGLSNAELTSIQYTASRETDKKEEAVTEDTTQTMTVKLNTGVLPIVDTDMYSLNDVLPESATQEELDNIVKTVATPFIKDTVQKVLPSVEIKATGVYHPKQYNFSGDELEFDLTVSSEEYEALKEKVLADNEFDKFLSDKYSSKSGFISTMPDSIEEFNTADNWKQLVQVIMFALRDEALTDVNEAYVNDFLKAVENEFPSDDMIEEDEGLGLSESKLKENLNK